MCSASQLLVSDGMMPPTGEFPPLSFLGGVCCCFFLFILFFLLCGKCLGLVGLPLVITPTKKVVHPNFFFQLGSGSGGSPEWSGGQSHLTPNLFYQACLPALFPSGSQGLSASLQWSCPRSSFPVSLSLSLSAISFLGRKTSPKNTEYKPTHALKSQGHTFYALWKFWKCEKFLYNSRGPSEGNGIETDFESFHKKF